MKKLSLGSSVYQKFFDIWNEVLKNLNKDISLLNIATNFKKIVELIQLNSWYDIAEAEVYWRSLHYITLDNINIISDYLDNSKEIEYLKTTFVWIFEILEISNEKVSFLDISNWNKYEIIWEWEGSESSLEKDFSKWDLIISRLIKLDDWWYNMKNYYYITNNIEENNYFEELKLWYKHMFSWIKDVLDIEERMSLLNKTNKEVNNTWVNINYLKRIKSILLKIIWKKIYKKAENILKDNKQSAFSDFFEFISLYKINTKDLDDLKEYVWLYLQENLKTPEEAKQEKLTKRLEMVMQTFFRELQETNSELPINRKATKGEIDLLEDKKNKWLKSKNSLFWDKTPLDFIHEVDPDYDISNLRLQQVPKHELEFYDWYTKYFSEEEKDIYEESIEKSRDKKFLEARDLAEQLLVEHSWFFRLKGNYISFYVNSIIDKYWDVRNDDFVENISLEELEKDFDFMLDLDNQLKELSRFKKWYSIVWAENIPQIKEFFAPLLRRLVTIKRDRIIDKLIKNKDEKALISRIRKIILDFDLEEFLDKVREEGTIYVDYKDLRIIEKKWYKEDEIRDILPYFWQKYKKKEDFIVDDIEKMYRKIWVRKLKSNELEKFNEFIIKKSQKIKKKKSKIRKLFEESIEWWEVEHPSMIIYLIEKYWGEEKNRSKADFIDSMDILGVDRDSL